MLRAGSVRATSPMMASFVDDVGVVDDVVVVNDDVDVLVVVVVVDAGAVRKDGTASGGGTRPLSTLCLALSIR